jgi:hypothetical protein
VVTAAVTTPVAGVTTPTPTVATATVVVATAGVGCLDGGGRSGHGRRGSRGRTHRERRGREERHSGHRQCLCCLTHGSCPICKAVRRAHMIMKKCELPHGNVQ